MPWSSIKCQIHRDQPLRLEQRPGYMPGLVCDICQQERTPTTPVAAAYKALQTMDRAIEQLRQLKEMRR